MALERNQWLAIGILSGMAYLFGKERGEAESFSAEWSHPDEECWICNTYTDMEDEPGFLEILNKEHEAHKMSAKLETIMNGFGWEHLVAEIDWFDKRGEVRHDYFMNNWGPRESQAHELGSFLLDISQQYVADKYGGGPKEEKAFFHYPDGEIKVKENANTVVIEMPNFFDPTLTNHLILKQIESDELAAESFEAEDSRRRLKVLMEGKSKEERKRISKMVQVRGLENTIAELMANAEAFAATTFDEDDDDSPKINRDEWMPRTDCEICARPFTINRFGQRLIQHYLKESDNGEKAWKSKKNTDGVRRTARNLTGFFLYEYGLDALNQYVLFQDKTGISDKVIELLRLSLVERVIAGDVVNLIEMMDMGDEVDSEPMFGKKFEDDFGSEGNEGVFI